MKREKALRIFELIADLLRRHNWAVMIDDDETLFIAVPPPSSIPTTIRDVKIEVMSDAYCEAGTCYFEIPFGLMFKYDEKIKKIVPLYDTLGEVWGDEQQREKNPAQFSRFEKIAPVVLEVEKIIKQANN